MMVFPHHLETVSRMKDSGNEERRMEDLDILPETMAYKA